ncbi:MAG: SH3 domain-containing protein [Clostridia bacterium]|nr:SH3 domain-containing protein [Clostridia bacterium]
MKSKMNIKSIVVLAALVFIAMFFINISFAANTAKISVETANLRETASGDSKILEQLSLNEKVEILEKNGDWYQVKARGITGYLRQDLITVEGNVEGSQQTQQQEEIQTKTEEGKISNEENEEKEETKKIVEDTKLKIVPSINATNIIEVKAEEEVTIIETLNDWVCIQTKTTKGWIRKDKLKSVEESEANVDNTETAKKVEENKPVEEKVLKTAFVNSETVNLRKEANTTSEVVSKLTLNMAVEVYAQENGWSKVKVSGKEGYISTALLSDKKQETSRSTKTTRKKTEQTQVKEQETTNTTQVATGKGATVVATAKNYIGSRYVYGASGPNSFDCSGFTSYVFKLHGVTLNRTAAGQYSNGVAVSRSSLQPGDLVMFGKSGINHVGIYIGGGQMVHAANKSRGVTTDTINSGYYNNNYVGARRVM